MAIKYESPSTQRGELRGNYNLTEHGELRGNYNLTEHGELRGKL